MKTPLYVLGMVLTVSLIYTNQSKACTVLPVNPTQQKNDLAANALTEMNVSIENVKYVSVKDYAGDYIWTPMCPKGLQSKATFTITFDDIEDPLTKGCTAIVKVEKSWIYEEGEPRYSFDFIQPAVCLQ